jgi:hypothetical protein
MKNISLLVYTKECIVVKTQDALYKGSGIVGSRAFTIISDYDDMIADVLIQKSEIIQTIITESKGTYLYPTGDDDAYTGKLLI